MKKSAFTLVELMVAMAIIGVLLGLAIYGVTAAQRSQRDTERKAALQDINIGIQSYVDTAGQQPSNIIFVRNTGTTTDPGYAYVGGTAAVGVNPAACAGNCKKVPLKGAANPSVNGTNTTTVATSTTGTQYTFHGTCGTGLTGYDLSASLESGNAFAASSCQ